MLYADPRTAVVTNELFSPFLGVMRGTYQGHSLSLVLESFGTTIRIAKRIKGGEKDPLTNSCFMQMIFLTQNSMPFIMDIIWRYSVLFGYIVNWSKPEAVPISKVCHAGIIKKLSFGWLQKGMKHLVVKSICDLDEIMQKMKLNVDGGSTLKLSL